VVGGKSVTAAAFEVGYEGATQFSREYARVFGLPPGQDAEQILARYVPTAAGRASVLRVRMQPGRLFP
jgi:AraC-like DNA-binding protein